jgi:arylsulfatase A-like enzyme
MLNNCHGPEAITSNLSRQHATFSELLNRNGYANSHVGKWHVGQDQTPTDFGFNHLGGGNNHQEPDDRDFDKYQRHHGVDPGEIELKETVYTTHPHDQELIAAKTPIQKEATHPYYIAEKTIEQLAEYARTGNNPFFHQMDFSGPHHPYVVPEPYASMYDPDEIDPWPSYNDTFYNKPQAHQNLLSYRGVDELSWESWAQAIAKYFGFVSFIDDQIGRILDTLDTFGLADNTVVIHTADHGDFTGSHRQFNKGPIMYDETYHIPLLVRWPDIVDPGSTCEEMVRLLDLMPTFLEIGGLTPPTNIDGRSIRPLLEERAPTDWPQSLFAEYHGDEFGFYSQRMVRTKTHKYIYNSPDINELYDLRTDPYELHNLIDQPEQEDVRTELKQSLIRWMEKTDDPLAHWAKKALGSD